MIDIDKIPAGREMDKLMAERVFGSMVKEIDLHPSDKFAYHDKLFLFSKCCCDSMREHEFRDKHDEQQLGISIKQREIFERRRQGNWVHGHHRYCFVPLGYYSISISAAWEIIEAIRRMGNRNLLVIQWSSQEWDVSFCYVNGKSMGVGRAPTAPLAICRAAFKVVKEK